MPRRFVPACLLALLTAQYGCASLKEGLGKAVFMDYDHVNSFARFQFEEPFQWVDQSWTGIQATGGYWAAFVVCNVRNEQSKAQAFPYDVHNFYVDHGGKKHFFRPLGPPDYMLTGGWGNAPESSLNGALNDTFRQATRVGPDTKSYPVGYDPAANHRFAIFVETGGPVDFAQPLVLRYQGYPNITFPRHQPPLEKEPTPTDTDDLGTVCRAQKK